MKGIFRLSVFASLSVALLMTGCEKDNDTNDGGAVDGDTTGGGATVVEWVDLGLPSGLLWASCNMGASKPAEYGGYYAWGETGLKAVYDESTYKYCANGDINQLTKYCSYSDYGYAGYVDTLTLLEPSDDVATVVLGADAYIPTLEDWQELLDNTTATWTSLDGVEGRRFVGSNGNSIFLPAAGYRTGSHIEIAGLTGCYWSSSLSVKYPGGACDFDFGFDFQDTGYGIRFNGQSVRAVCSAQ